LAMAIYQNYSSRMSADPEWAAE
ncbi:hypothetical protein, partial [Salmonella enterica]